VLSLLRFKTMVSLVRDKVLLVHLSYGNDDNTRQFIVLKTMSDQMSAKLKWLAFMVH